MRANDRRKRVDALALAAWGLVVGAAGALAYVEVESLAIRWNFDPTSTSATALGAALFGLQAGLVYLAVGRHARRLVFFKLVDAHPRCLNCQYDLTGLTSPTCPECGKPPPPKFDQGP